MTYVPPQGNLISINFDDVDYIAPQGNLVALDFSIQSGSIGESQYAFPNSIYIAGFGDHSIRLAYQYINPEGIDEISAGVPAIRNNTTVVKPDGWRSSNVGRPPSIVSYFKDIYPKSINSSVYGRPFVYNLTQYRNLNGINSQAIGRPYLQGGVKYLSPRSFGASTYGKALLVNTTANQDIKPSGINSLSVPRPDVSPRILYPKGLALSSMGKPDIRSPVLIPKGLSHTQYGKTTVWYHTRPLGVTSIMSFESGYPRVFDPTRFITPAPFNRSSVFGDVAITNKSVFIKPSSIFDEVVTPWAIVENNRRYQKPSGINSQAFGNADIGNKTPSIFVGSISPPAFNMPAIGYRIRAIKPSGFDHLNIGRAVLTKTPELLPKGLAAPAFNAPTVWYKNRIVDVNKNGIDSFKSGKATTWFRYRYVNPISWVSSKFASPSLTHGVRNIDAKGFVRDSYGNAWVSQGTRRIEPVGIYNDYASKHMVGGTRYINPIGYIATQWGTRIIPESQSISPLGFAGALGQANVGLYTRYLRPIGYISVGKQPADRWGGNGIYNKRQYITQVFDNTSGLVPPKWSEWQSIQNRNRRIGATGFNSQKFGYSQIANNATPLLPKGIAPLAISGGMIASSERSIGLQGIEPPLIGTWSVVYNGARVIKPQVNIQTSIGTASVVNTRRYYDRVGRIESQEFGEPMVSFRVRTIDVERRYSIAPPIIRLPTIDNLTKYVSFRGYETAAYGLPSLAIRFNIIAPKWIHRDNVGNPRIHNVTPELGLFGHNSQEFGLSAIRTQWRTVQAFGDRATLFGRHKISDSKQNIGVSGWRDTNVTQKHTVKGSGAPLYSEQKISLDGYMDYGQGEGEGKYISGYGISFDEKLFGKRVPKPGLNQNVLYAEGVDSSVFGVNKIHSNNIQVVPGIAIHNMSKDTIVYNKTQTIRLTEENSIKSEIEVGKPRMSPWTIYAVVEAPLQAIRNYNTNHRLHYVDSNGGYRNPGVVFGEPRIESKHRTIKTNGRGMSFVEKPTIALTTKIIKVNSFGNNKMGLPSIPFSLQSIAPFNNKEPLSTYGRPTVSIIDNRDKTASPKGFISMVFGNTNIQMLNRAITTRGHNSEAMGTRKTNDKPYMWQGLRVGEHVPMSIGAGMTSLHGDTMVSLRVREISLEGFNAFASEYDTSNFNKRMTVKRNRTQGPEPQRITTQGFDNQEHGLSSMKYGQQFIRPDGNADQFRKGAF